MEYFIGVILLTALLLISYIAYYVIIRKFFKCRKHHPLLESSLQIVALILVTTLMLVVFTPVIWKKMFAALLDPEYKLLLVFMGYVMCIALFSIFYYLMFWFSAENFIFVSEISAKRLKKALTETELRVSEIENALLALETITKSLKNGSSTAARLADLDKFVKCTETPQNIRGNSSMWFVLGDDGLYTAYETIVVPNMGIHTLLYVYNRTKKLETFSFPNNSPSSSQDLIELHEEAIVRCKNLSFNLDKKLRSFRTDYPDAWNYVDFLYFSTITQTTVGYGDILPNCTCVRALVTTQILIGYFIIAIAINFRFGT